MKHPEYYHLRPFGMLNKNLEMTSDLYQHVFDYNQIKYLTKQMKVKHGRWIHRVHPRLLKGQVQKNELQYISTPQMMRKNENHFISSKWRPIHI